MSVNVNLLIKEAIANMPDTLNTKKEVDEYYKVAMKEINEKLKEEKKANKETKTKDKATPKKRVAKAKPVEVDDDGNEIVKVKKPLNNYQKFIQEQRPKVKEDYPELSGEEIFKKIAELWKQHKEDINNGDGEPKKDSDEEPKSDSEADEAKTVKAAEAAEAAEAYINSEEEDEAYEVAEVAEAAKADVKTTVVVEEKKEKPKEKKEKKPKKETS